MRAGGSDQAAQVVNFQNHEWLVSANGRSTVVEAWGDLVVALFTGAAVVGLIITMT
jgi:hypothetical protein